MQYIKMSLNYNDMSVGFDKAFGITGINPGGIVIPICLVFSYYIPGGSVADANFGIDLWWGPGIVAANLIWQIPASAVPFYYQQRFVSYVDGFRVSTGRSTWIHYPDQAGANAYGQDIYINPTGTLMTDGLGTEFMEIGLWYQIWLP